MCLIRYVSKIFEIFPPMLTNQLVIVDKQGWTDELKVNIDSRMNTIINDDQTNLWFLKTTEEIVKISLFFDSFKEEFVNLRVLTRNVMKKENNILHFNWPNEITYEQWKGEHAMALERIQMVAQDKEINWVDEEQPQDRWAQVAAIQMVPQAIESIEERNKDATMATKERKVE